MNSQEIIEYVMNSPNNTNPAILKQMIDANNTGNKISWNDLTDKPFYHIESETRETLLPTREQIFGVGDMGDASAIIEEDILSNIEIGDVVEFVINETAVKYIVSNTSEIGDASVEGGVRYEKFTGYCMLFVNPSFNITWENKSATISVNKVINNKEIKTIDPMYLPDDYINHLIDTKLGVIENGTY